MDFEVSNDFDAPLERVYAIHRTPEYYKTKYEALGQTSVEVIECAQDGELFRIRTRREIPLNVPSFARKILSPATAVSQTDEWWVTDGRPEGRWKMEAAGKPMTMEGTMRIEPRGPAACTQVIDGKVTVSVRVVGGMVAKYLAGDARRSLEREYGFTRDYLAR